MADEALILVAVFDAGCISFVSHRVHGLIPACSKKRRASRTW
jgi:hypothetical protein